jgi:hypothetical protein
MTAASGFLGCFRDGNGSAWPLVHHMWPDRTPDLLEPDADLCTTRCANRSFSFAGTVWGGGAITQCYCSHVVAEPSRRLPDYKCNMLALNYMLREMPGPCRPSLESCGAWMTMSVFYVGHPAGRPRLPPPPTEPPMLINPCVGRPFSEQPWCDPRRSVDERARDAVSRMSREEKVDALGNGGGGPSGSWAIASLGLPEYNWWNEAEHGVGSSTRHTRTTNFPMPLTAASSFNRTLWHATGRQIGREARAAMNAGDAYSTFWTPVVNLASEPRWGRNLETAGEDPYASRSRFTHSMISASWTDDGRHFSAYSSRYLAGEYAVSRAYPLPQVGAKGSPSPKGSESPPPKGSSSPKGSPPPKSSISEHQCRSHFSRTA